MRRLLLLMFIALLASGCAESATPTAVVEVDLTNLQPIPARYSEGVMPLRISVAAIVSPQGTAESYQPLLDYLSQASGRPVELVQRRTYQETNDLIERGEVDVAFVCTSAYLAGRDAFGLELLAAPEVEGESVYHSLLIVPAGSTAASMADLEGTVFAFTDPISFSGRAYPTYLVQQLGHTPDAFFSRTFFTYSHDDAIRAVADRLADGAAVDSLVYDFAVERDPSLAERLQVIHKSPPFGIPPVVVSPDVRPQQRTMLQEALLTMNDSQEGQAALQALGLDGFVSIEDSAYDGARAITRQIGALLQ